MVAALPCSWSRAPEETGKTKVAIDCVGYIFLHDPNFNKKVLVISPSSVVPVWQNEFNDHANYPCEIKPLTGPSVKRIDALESWKVNSDAVNVAIINYESSWRISDELTTWKPDVLILDEMQRVKTPGTRQSKATHLIAAKCRYRLGLSGTPVTQSPLDLFSEYKALDPSIFGRSYYSFRNHYAIMGGFQRHQVVAFKNLPELVEKAHRIAFRVTKEEALDLPEFTDQTIYCELEPKAQRLYDQMKKTSVMEMESEKSITAVNVLAKLLRLSQITGGFIPDPEDGRPEMVSSAKYDLLRETVSDLLDAGKKVVVFARFVPEIKAICRYLDNANIRYSLIMGEVPQDQRGEMVRQFQEDPQVKVFVAQIQTAGLGITLTAADTAIFYSLDYSFANYDQARCRIHRIGQKNACTYIHLIAQGTVDEKIMAALKQKKSVADMVVDGWRDMF